MVTLPFIVILPDGSQHPIGSIFFRRDATVARITTIPAKALGEYFAIEGEELERVRIEVSLNGTTHAWGPIPERRM